MENKQNRFRGVVETVRTNVRQGWNRLVGALGLENVRERWSNGTIAGETVAELGAMAQSIDRTIGAARENWDARGENFRERLTSAIGEATNNLRVGYNNLRERVVVGINRFRREARDFGLVAAINDRIRNVAGQVGEMVVEAADFLTELPLRTVMAANNSRLSVEQAKIIAIAKIGKQAETNRPGWGREVLNLNPAVENMGRRYVEFGAKAEKAKIKLISLIEKREVMRMERSLSKIRKLTSSLSFS